MLRKNRDLATIEKFMVITISEVIIGTMTAAYIGGSVITSAVKAASKDCGVIYNIENLLDGDWFCPSK